MKLGLQIVVGILSLIPAWYGISNVIMGAAALMPAADVTTAIDSQFRYLSGIYIGLAIIIWCVIPRIEEHTFIFRLVVLALFLGGLARLYSYITLGAPPSNMVGGMVLELCLPLLILWHNRIREA